MHKHEGHMGPIYTFRVASWSGCWLRLYAPACPPKSAWGASSCSQPSPDHCCCGLKLFRFLTQAAAQAQWQHQAWVSSALARICRLLCLGRKYGDAAGHA